MADDYLNRSGAKNQLTQAVATLLEVHPANPVVFLAHHFDGMVGRVHRAVRMVRACPPDRDAAFSNTIHRAFLELKGCSTAVESPQLDPRGTSGLKRGISRRDYDEVLVALTKVVPLQLQPRVLDALRGHGATTVEANDVTLAEFERGVRICVLLEELFDVLEELFDSIDKGGMGEVKLGVLLSALENVVQHSKQRDLDEAALGFLRTHIRAHYDDPNASDAETGTTSRPMDDLARYVRLPDLYELVFRAVFAPLSL